MPDAMVEVIPTTEVDRACRAHRGDGGIRSYTASSPYYLAIAEAMKSTPLALRVIDPHERSSIVLGRLRTEPQHARIGYLRMPLPSLLTYTVIYQGILGCCDPENLIGALDKWLRREHRVQQIVFTKLDADSGLARALLQHRRSTAMPAEPHWRLELPQAIEDLLARHSGKHRQRLRWERRKLEESVGGTLEHDVLGTPDDIESILQICESVGERTYHAKVGGMVRRDSVWRAVLAALAASDSLACHLFRVGEDVIAFVLTARHEGATHVIAMAHLPEHARYSPGKHLLLEVLRDSCDRGMRWVDYGFGDAQYKNVYGSHCEQERTLVLSAPSLRATSVRWTLGMTAEAHKGLQHALGSRFATRIKRRWRARAAEAQARGGGDG